MAMAVNQALKTQDYEQIDVLKGMKDEDLNKYLEDIYDEELGKRDPHVIDRSEADTDLDSSVLQEYWVDFDDEEAKVGK
jgi:hypothetical protein